MSKTKTEMAAEWVDINSLTPWAENPRDNKAAVQSVADSIKRFGFASPIIALADNRIAEIAEWNDEKLGAILEDLKENEIDVSGLGFTDEELAGLLDMPKLDGEENYSRKVEAPIYEITGECPDTSEIYDNDKTNSLIQAIENADIDLSTKHFLISAARRHTVFRYDKIAEYYAHASPEVQSLSMDIPDESLLWLMIQIIQ